MSRLSALLIHGTDLFLHHPSTVDHTTTPGDSAAPPPPHPAPLEHCAVGSPWQMQCWWTVFTWPSRWSRASACPRRRGARPSYSRQSVGTDQHHPQHPLPWGKRASHPLLPHHRGVPPVPQHGSSCGCWAPLGVLGDSWVCAPLPRNIQLCAAPCDHPWPPHSVARTQEREEQGSVCCCCTSLALKNKILSSLFLQVFPSYSR